MDPVERRVLELHIEQIEKLLERGKNIAKEAIQTDPYVGDELRWPKRAGFLEAKIEAVLEYIQWVEEEVQRLKGELLS